MSAIYKTPLCTNCGIDAEWGETKEILERIDHQFVRTISVTVCKCGEQIRETLEGRLYQPE